MQYKKIIKKKLMSVKTASSPKKSEKMHFDKITISRDIERNLEYKEEDVIIKKWEGDEESSNMYCAKIENKFLGVLNELFEREGYCINNYSNGDSYFGYYSEDKRDKHGFYEFKPEIKNGIRNQEFYFGLWKNDNRNNRGVNLWISESSKKKPFSDFDNANFSAFIGLFENNIYNKGTYLYKEEDDYYVYHGYLNIKGEREGENCLFYSSTLEECFYGKYEENEFVDGFVCKYDDNGNVKDLCKYDNDKIIKEEDLNSKEVNDICKKLFIFRNVIMEKDYFGDVYKCFGNVYNFKNKQIKDIDILNTDKYLDIMTAAISYNKATIFNDIEKFVF